MIRVVFDTNVLFSAAFKRVGIPAQLLDLVAEGFLTPCISDAILAEYREVLGRPILRPHVKRTEELLHWIAQFAVHVSPSERLALCADADDDCFLECALEAEAAYLVTGNLRHFPRNFRQVAIVSPRQLLDGLRAKPG